MRLGSIDPLGLELGDSLGACSPPGVGGFVGFPPGAADSFGPDEGC